MPASRASNLLGALTVALADRIGASGAGTGELDASTAAALVTVATYPGEPVDALARSLRLTPAGATRLIDRLAARGLVERRLGEADRRSRSLWATARGEAAATEVLAARRAALDEALAPLPLADVARLEGLLEAMLGAVTPDRATCDRTCRLCDLGACPQDRCPVEQAALRGEEDGEWET